VDPSCCNKGHGLDPLRATEQTPRQKSTNDLADFRVPFRELLMEAGFCLSSGARVVIAPATFKGSLRAREAAEAMAHGVRDVIPSAVIVLVPLADGGEGLVEVLAPPLGATLMRTTVHGPLEGMRVDAAWALVRRERTAVIEMAAAAGLSLVPRLRRDPCVTTSYGVGELLLAAMEEGASTIILGLGGSVTSDGGAGMAEALGVRFLDASGNALRRGGMALGGLDRIDCAGIDRRVAATRIVAAVDVQNPLTGPSGAAAVYGPQKGLRPEDVAPLDRALGHFARVAARDCGLDCAGIPGAGAAGGLGAGVLLFCGGVLRPGIEIVLEALGFDGLLARASLILTGEGSLDSQTRQGKAVQGVLEHAARAGVPVAAVAGKLGPGMREAARDLGLADLETLVDPDTSEADAMRGASALLRSRTALLVSRHV
jgi:glycerate kinase